MSRKTAPTCSCRLLRLNRQCRDAGLRRPCRFTTSHDGSQLRPVATFVLLGMFATDIKIVDYTINGQETGIMMLFLAMTLHAMIVPGKKAWLRLGMASTGPRCGRGRMVASMAAFWR